MRKIYASLLLLAFALIIINGCSENSNVPTNPNQTQNFNVEPTGGSWKTIVLSSPNAVSIPVPPEQNSNTTITELNEIRNLRKNLTQDMQVQINQWSGNNILIWNQVSRNLVIKYGTNPPLASRLYALLSVAQYDALVAAWNQKYKYNRVAPSVAASDIIPTGTVTNLPVYPSTEAVIAGASAEIIKYVYPNIADSIEAIAKSAEEAKIYAGLNYRSDITAGDSLGIIVARLVIERAKTDNSDAKWSGTVPIGDGMWFSSEKPPVAPMLPLWGNVKGWCIENGNNYMCPPPPAFNSAEFKTALAEIRQISDNRTQEQIDIAKFWNDGKGSATPPGHWNQIASDMITQNNMNELRSARTLSLMNMAMMDAGICCWATKFKYWYIRPSQADTNITLVVGLPNFPSYSSGHSSFSGAAAAVLGYIFPSQKTNLDAMALQAAMSRMYGGIHYRFDSEKGLDNGKMIGQMAVQKGMSDGAP